MLQKVLLYIRTFTWHLKNTFNVCRALKKYVKSGNILQCSFSHQNLKSRKMHQCLAYYLLHTYAFEIRKFKGIIRLLGWNSINLLKSLLLQLWNHRAAAQKCATARNVTIASHRLAKFSVSFTLATALVFIFCWQLYYSWDIYKSSCVSWILWSKYHTMLCYTIKKKIVRYFNSEKLLLFFILLLLLFVSRGSVLRNVEK